ncbi:type 1 fimbrial protein [Klebsiella pneumoniae]|nr:type 1 fimbrial protein [Klebsiella pneumoniae]
MLTCDYLIRFEYERKGTLLVVGSLLALSLATQTTARAAGTLNFTGKIINESCQIANNGGDVNVDFGNVDMSALKSHEAKNRRNAVHHQPHRLPTGAEHQYQPRKVLRTPTLTAPALPVLALSDSADTAKGVGIEVFSSPDGSTEGTQLTFDKQSKTAVSQADENGDIAFNFIADLKSDSSQDVTAGNINATANIDIVYE